MADIGSTSIYLLSTAPILNKKAPTRPIIVRTVVGSTFKNSHECNILVKFIPTEPRTGHILPGLQRHYPVSIAPLWGAGCKVLFTNEDLMVTKIDQLVWKVWHYLKKHFLETTTVTINTFCQLSIPTEHNGIINPYPTYYIFRLVK